MPTPTPPLAVDPPPRTASGTSSGRGTPPSVALRVADTWPVALAVAVALVPWYATLLVHIPGFLQLDDLLGHADSGAFARLLDDFALSRVYGDATGDIGKDPAANAQKHKLHHVLYGVVGSTLASVWRAVPGLSGREAVLLVNATLGAVNAWLVHVLAGRVSPDAPLRIAAMVLYAVAMSSIVLSAQPDSWCFTGTLVLLFFVLLLDARVPPAALAAYVGVAMLNNVLLVLLGVPLLLTAVTTGRMPVRHAALVLPALAAGTWLGALWALAMLDPGWYPDAFLRYLLWFGRFDRGYHTASWHELPVFARSVATVLLASITSDPPTPTFSPAAASHTLRGIGHPLATLAIWAVGAAAAVTGAWSARVAAAGRRDPSTALAVHVALATAVVVVTSWPSAFLYSPLVTGALVVLLHAAFARRGPAGRAAFVALTLLVAAANARTIERVVHLAAQEGSRGLGR